MARKTLTAIIAGAITLLAANSASSQDLRKSSFYNPGASFTPTAGKTYELALKDTYQPRGGSVIEALTEIYEKSEIGKRRAEKLKLKQEGTPDFEPASMAFAPRKAGKIGKHFGVSLNGKGFRLYAEAYAMRNYWTREVKPGFQVQVKIKY